MFYSYAILVECDKYASVQRTHLLRHCCGAYQVLNLNYFNAECTVGTMITPTPCECCMWLQCLTSHYILFSHQFIQGSICFYCYLYKQLVYVLFRGCLVTLVLGLKFSLYLVQFMGLISWLDRWRATRVERFHSRFGERRDSIPDPESGVKWFHFLCGSTAKRAGLREQRYGGIPLFYLERACPKLVEIFLIQNRSNRSIRSPNKYRMERPHPTSLSNQTDLKVLKTH